MWIEAPNLGEDARWFEALALLNQTRDALQMHGPCHIVLAGPQALHPMVTRRAPDLASFMRLVLRFGDTVEELPPGTVPPSTDSELLATRLRTAATKKYGWHDFTGLGEPLPRRDVTYQQFFVRLRLRNEEPTTDPSPIDSSALESLVLDDPPCRIGILGDPGSGKSTLARYIAHALSLRDTRRAPLLLTARSWDTDDDCVNLLELAARELSATLSIHATTKALEALCTDGRAFLIVDGIDEATERAMRQHWERLEYFAIAYPTVPILATSRATSPYDLSLDRSFLVLRLEPLDDGGLEDFVHGWYDVMQNDPAKRLLQRVTLLHTLETTPRAKTLARNPRLATLLALNADAMVDDSMRERVLAELQAIAGQGFDPPDSIAIETS